MTVSWASFAVGDLISWHGAGHNDRRPWRVVAVQDAHTLTVERMTFRGYVVWKARALWLRFRARVRDFVKMAVAGLR